jgi:hypothetical protein
MSNSVLCFDFFESDDAVESDGETGRLTRAAAAAGGEAMLVISLAEFDDDSAAAGACVGCFVRMCFHAFPLLSFTAATV